MGSFQVAGLSCVNMEMLCIANGSDSSLWRLPRCALSLLLKIGSISLDAFEFHICRNFLVAVAGPFLSFLKKIAVTRLLFSGWARDPSFLYSLGEHHCKQ